MKEKKLKNITKVESQRGRKLMLFTIVISTNINFCNKNEKW